MADGELGSPLAVAAYEALRALIWQLINNDAIRAEPLVRELELAAGDVSPEAAAMLAILAPIARMASQHKTTPQD